MITKTTLSFVLTLILTAIALTQTSQFMTEQRLLDGELSADDPLENNLGRFDAYEMDLEAGDQLYIGLYSENFSPKLILLSPSDEIFRRKPSQGQPFIEFQGIVKENGTWEIAVVGDSTASGAYKLMYLWVADNTVSLDENADFCTTLKFLLAHCAVDFHFLKQDTVSGKSGVWTPTVILEGAKTAEIVSPSREWYNALMYSGYNRTRAEQQYTRLVEDITDCLGDNWETETQDWKETGVISRYQQKYFKITENVQESNRYVRVEFFDFTKGSTQSQHSYEVRVVINRHRQ